MNDHITNLTQRPPRSPRVRLGGFVILPRLLDKARATLAGTPGEYHFNCPLDQQFLLFAGIDAEALKAQVAQGFGDGALLAWIEANAKNPRTSVEIPAWSEYQERRAPSDLDSREFFQGEHKRIAATRGDVMTWFDLLDLDDFASFGGQP